MSITSDVVIDMLLLLIGLSDFNWGLKMYKNNNVSGNLRKTNSFISRGGALVIAILSFIPSITYATNGLFMIGTGNKSRGMGGVGVATPLDSLSATNNPAVISGMKNRFDIGADFFVPDVDGSLGSVSSESEASINGIGLDSTFIMPAMGGTYRWTDKITLGAAMVPIGGGGTEYSENFFEAAAAGSSSAPGVGDRLGVSLVMGEVVSTIAYQATDIHSFGASLLIGIARFEAYGLGLFDAFTQTQGTLKNFSNQGKEWSLGIGARIGWLANYGNLKVGASYTSEVDMNEFDHYSELFAEHGDIDIPASAAIGISYQATPDLLVALDIQRTFYEDVRTISNTGPNLAGSSNGPLGGDDRRLGRKNGLGFGWTDRNVYKIGAEYNLNETWLFRAGWNYSESPINEDREIIFNLLAPATVEHHLTLGTTFSISPEMAINVSYVHAYRNTQSGPTYVSDDGSNLGTLSMKQDSIGASFSMQY